MSSIEWVLIAAIITVLLIAAIYLNNVLIASQFDKLREQRIEQNSDYFKEYAYE